MGCLYDWSPAFLFSQIKQYIVTADFNGANKFSCFLGLPWSRTYGLAAWKHSSKASSSNTSVSQFLQNDLAVVSFKLTIIRSPKSPQWFPTLHPLCLVVLSWVLRLLCMLNIIPKFSNFQTIIDIVDMVRGSNG
jgi:hypothetical protein